MDFLGRALTINVASSIEIGCTDDILLCCLKTLRLPNEVINVTPPKGGENRKALESINSKTTRNLHSILQSSKYPKIPMLCINDSLLEVGHIDQDSQALVLEDGGTGGMP